MTTAARPTFEPAKGGRGKNEGDLGAMSKQYSSRDLPSHTKLKYRQDGQGSVDEQRGRDFRRDLEERERSTREKRDRNRDPQANSFTTKRQRLEQLPASNLDADDPADDEDDEEDDSDDEDDTAVLLAELQKIKKERATERSKQEMERKIEEERIRTENILRGNPLINQDTRSDFSVKRRWDDDVVFKNCAKGIDTKKGFINDTLRSEFHKKFMEKYVK